MDPNELCFLQCLIKMSRPLTKHQKLSKTLGQEVFQGFTQQTGHKAHQALPIHKFTVARAMSTHDEEVGDVSVKLAVECLLCRSKRSRTNGGGTKFQQRCAAPARHPMFICSWPRQDLKVCCAYSCAPIPKESHPGAVPCPNAQISAAM